MVYYLVKVIWMHSNLNGRTGLLTREGTSSWFPSGADFSRVNRVCLCLFFPAFLLTMNRGFLFAPCFDHFQSGHSSGSAISSHLWCEGHYE